VGTFSKDKSLIYWKLGDITLDQYDSGPHKLLARFATESEAKPGNVEARWEVSGEHAAGIGSGLSMSHLDISSEGPREEGTDPFADEGRRRLKHLVERSAYPEKVDQREVYSSVMSRNSWRRQRKALDFKVSIRCHQ
jgi:hypothetical protein